jgi:hypothetical protein
MTITDGISRFSARPLRRRSRCYGPVIVALFAMMIVWIPQLAVSQSAMDPTNATGAIGNDQFSPQTPVQTFVDPQSGQWYGRYVFYEMVPVAKYEYRPVVEKQFVPEWIQETKQTTQVQAVPIVTYQWQLLHVPNWNPFAQARQYWQYTPLVQYQPRYTLVNQPITYQKYVEKEVTKYVPEMVVKPERVAQFADRPLMAGNSNLQTGAVASAPVATPPPIRPIDQLAYGPTSYVQAAPPPYTVNPQVATGAPYGYANAYPQSAAAVASNPYGWHYGNRWSSSPYINNPTPNAGWVRPAVQPTMIEMANPSPAAASPFSRTGSLFAGGLFTNRAGNVAPSAPAIAGYSWFGNPNTSSSGMGSSMGFRPRTDTYSSPGGQWNLTPVDNYREPAQSGLPSSFIR